MDNSDRYKRARALHLSNQLITLVVPCDAAACKPCSLFRMLCPAL